MRMNNYGEKTILYYPTIRIKDGTWLRNALLYWDKGKRFLLPRSYGAIFLP